MDYFDLILKRESCRNFDETRPISNEAIMKCIDAAHLAPSACNSQPYSFVVTNTPEKSKALAKCVQALGMNQFASECPAFIVVLQEPSNLTAQVSERIKHQDFSSVDIGLATMQLCLAATSLGLSSCILGWLTEDKIKTLLNIPAQKRVRLVICLGYAKNDTLRKKIRSSTDDIVRFVK